MTDGKGIVVIGERNQPGGHKKMAFDFFHCLHDAWARAGNRPPAPLRPHLPAWRSSPKSALWEGMEKQEESSAPRAKQAKRAKGIKQVGERYGMGEMTLHNLIKANPGKVAAQVDRGPNLPVPGASPLEGRGGLTVD